MLEIEHFYSQVPEAEANQVSVGYPTVSDATAILRHKPWEQRDRKKQEIDRELQPKFAGLPGVTAFHTNPPSLGHSARSKPVEFVIMSQASSPELATMVDNFLTNIRKIT